MAINLTERYIKGVQERWFKKSFTASMAGNEIEFMGDKTVKTHSVDVAPLYDYNRSGFMGSNLGSRYGTPYDLTDSENEYTITGDKSFTYIIDKGDEVNQDHIKNADRALQRQLDLVVYPFFDTYNLKTWAYKAGKRWVVNQEVAATTAAATNNSEAIVNALIDCQIWDDNMFVPEGSRGLICDGTFFKKIKQNANFIYTEKMVGKKYNYELGEIAGFRIVKVPDRYMPSGVHALITCKQALIAPNKLKEYKIHTDPVGLNGWLTEGRFMHDAFVLSPKRCTIQTIEFNTSKYSCPDVYGAGNSSTDVVFTSSGATAVWWTTDGSDPLTSMHVHKSANMLVTLSDVINATNMAAPYEERELQTGNVLKLVVAAVNTSANGFAPSTVRAYKGVTLTSNITSAGLNSAIANGNIDEWYQF